MNARLSCRAVPASLACAAALVLTGCGGGSDSAGTDLSEAASRAGGGVTGSGITARNGPVLARDSLDLATSLHDLARTNYGTLTGAALQTARRVPDVVTLASRHLEWLAGASIPDGRTLGGVVITATFPCADGGTFSVAFDDADDNDRLSSGDGAMFTFSACAADGVLVNGAIGYSGIGIRGPAGAPTELEASFTYTRLRVLEAGIEATVDGAAHYRVVVTTAAPQPLAIEAHTVIPSLTYASSDGWRYTLTDVELRTETDYGRSTYTFALAGTTVDPAVGTMTVATPARFSGALGQPPLQGIMTVRASDGSQVRLTSLAARGARIEIDANADGSFESNVTLTWPALGAL